MDEEGKIITVVYSTDNMGEEDPDEGDDIPDKFQKKLTYTVEHGKWNDESNDPIVKVVTLKEGETPSENGQATVEIPAVGQRPDKGYNEGNWADPQPATTITKDSASEYKYEYVIGSYQLKIDYVNEDGEAVETSHEDTLEFGETYSVKPDKYQAKVDYEAVNGSVNIDTVYVTLFDENNEWAEDGTGHLSEDQIATATAATGYDQATLSWEPETPTTSYDITGDMKFTASFTRDFTEIEVSSYTGTYDGQGHNVTVNGTISSDKVQYSLDGGTTYQDSLSVVNVTTDNNGQYPVKVKVTNGG